MKAMLAVLLAATALAGPALAQGDPDQGFVPGPPAAEPLPPSPSDTPSQPGPDQTGPAQPGPSSSYEPATADGLGDVLAVDELDGAWVGTWTRRPGTDIFDAVWRNAQGQEAHDVIRLVSAGGGRFTFSRDGQSGPNGTYSGTLGPDGRTITGAASWYQPGWVWKVVIQGGGDRQTYGPSEGPAPESAAAEPYPENPPPETRGDNGYQPQEVQLADTWNTAGCGLTDTATLDLPQATHLTRVALWYNWRQGENRVRYTLSADGRTVGGGDLTRGGCDPYQTAWCEARDAPEADLPAGRVEFRLERAGVCQNGGSGGAGFIRAWGYPAGR